MNIITTGKKGRGLGGNLRFPSSSLNIIEMELKN